MRHASGAAPAALNSHIRVLWLRAAVAVLAAALPLAAQYDHAAEAFGGISGIRSQPGEELNKTNLPGLHGSFTGYANKTWGFRADAALYRSQATAPPNIGGITKVDLDQLFFLFGPVYRPVRKEAYAVSVHGGAGLARGKTDLLTGQQGGAAIDLSVNSTSLAFGGGASFDLNLHPEWIWRVVQADYIGTRFGSTLQHNIRLSTGVVYRFGERKGPF